MENHVEIWLSRQNCCNGSQFHCGMQDSVQDDGEHSVPFQVMSRTKQGCVLPPALFSMVFIALLNDAYC